LFNIPDDADARASDVILKGAFAKTLMERGDRLKVLYDHDMKRLIGKVEKAEEDDKGLFVELLISEAEDDIQKKIREGIYDELSIGYVTIQSEWIQNGQEDVRVLKEIKLYEVSIVPLSKHPLTKFKEVKSAEDQASQLEKAFDELIDTEKNEERKYSLMMLKTLAVSVPSQSHEETHPTTWNT